MKILRYTSILLTLLLSQTLCAQTTEKQNKFMQHIERIFSETDTTYIAPNKYNLTFMVEQSFWHERYRLGTRINDGRQNINFAPTPTPKIGAYFGWRWIFLGLSFSIPELIGKNKSGTSKKEYVFNLYSSRVGGDFYYRKTGSDFRISSYSGFDLPKNYEGQQFEGFQSKIIGLNAYWIFNNKKFSYPAAYSQSTNQKRSCGSFMAGFSYSHHDISFDHTKLPSDMMEQIRPSLKFNSLEYRDYNLSFGYGYNWVFAKNCLLNVSLMPAIAYKKAKVNGEPTNNTADERWLRWMNDINLDLVTRAGITWNNSKYYVGASLVLNTYDYRRSDFSMTNSFGSLRIYAGFNFWKRKEYRKEKP